MKDYETTKTHNILIAVDVQNDFVSGSLAVDGGEQVIDPINQLAAAVRAGLGRVALTRDWHPAETPHFENWPVHCVAGSEGAEFAPGLDIQPEDMILSKGMGQTDGYSGIEAVGDSGATLEHLIENRQQRLHRVRLFIGGLATDYCVKATALDLAERFSGDLSIDIYGVTSAMRAVNLQPTDGDAALAAMAEAGVQMLDLESALNIINDSDMEL